MTFRTPYHRGLVRRIAIGLALAAVAAPGATAQTPTPADLSSRALGATLQPAAGHLDATNLPCWPTCQSLEPQITIPSDLSGRQMGPATFTDDILMTTAAADGFDWRDAGVGAAIAAAVALVLGALALLAGRRREPAGA